MILTNHIQEEPIVIDTCSMPPIKKKVRKVDAQIPTESRRLWQHLTKALYQNDIDTATSCKHEVIITAILQIYACILSD